MKRVSVEQAFLWSQGFVAREWRLLLPVMLAFMALPPLLVDLVAPEAAKAFMLPLNDLESGRAQISVAGLLMGLAIVLLNCVGQLSLVALALVPRISVREAIVLAFGRLATLIVTGLVTLSIVMFAAVVAAIALNMTGINLASQKLLLLAVIFAFLLFIWIRLIALGPLIVERHIGPIAAMRRAWDLSKGSFWRISAAFIVYIIGATVVVSALSSALGAVLTIGGKAVGQPEVGLVLANVVFRVGVAAGGAGLQILIVSLYRQLAVSRSGT